MVLSIWFFQSQASASDDHLLNQAHFHHSLECFCSYNRVFFTLLTGMIRNEFVAILIKQKAVQQGGGALIRSCLPVDVLVNQDLLHFLPDFWIDDGFMLT